MMAWFCVLTPVLLDMSVDNCADSLVNSKGHAMAVIVAPATAPAPPKQAMVENVGIAPLVLATTSGELPVAL